MSRIHTIALPAASLLQRCRDSGAYVDGYACEVGFAVTHADFVEAFYTTWLFKVERALLRWLVSRPSSDADAHELAAARAETFAAWRVEARDVDQLLLADFTGRTKSWLMVAPTAAGTRLYFGSAVVAKPRGDDGVVRMGFPFGALLGFHRLYSRALLASARRRLARRQFTDSRTGARSDVEN